MNAKVIGGILLVVGTSIGGGMLALPIASATSGFVASSCLLIACWLVMMLPAFLILEVNLWLPPGTNLISMARKTLGSVGAGISWISYLLLLYCLISAYISSGQDMLGNLLKLAHFSLPAWANPCIFVAIFSLIVALGIRSVDYVNRGLMSLKLIAYLLLIVFVITYIKLPNLAHSQPAALKGSIMVMITSYGLATLVPSLRAYFKDELQQLRKVILIGSCIPLVCYLLWNLVVLGSLPLQGENGLAGMMQSSDSTSALVNALSRELSNDWVTTFVHLFASICVLTSFMAVSLGLMDFLADGFKTTKQGRSGVLIYFLTFVPPLILVLFYPGLFIKGLAYAGLCCVVLLLLLPVLMAWRGRYHLQLAGSGYRLWGGKILLLLLLVAAFVVLGVGVSQL